VGDAFSWAVPALGGCAGLGLRELHQATAPAKDWLSFNLKRLIFSLIRSLILDLWQGHEHCRRGQEVGGQQARAFSAAVLDDVVAQQIGVRSGDAV